MEVEAGQSLVRSGRSIGFVTWIRWFQTPNDWWSRPACDYIILSVGLP